MTTRDTNSKSTQGTTRRYTAVKPTTSSSDPWIAFLVKVLFVALIIFMLPKLVEGGKRSRTAGSKHRKTAERKFSAIRDECQYESTSCKSIDVIEEAMNCVHQCMSENCYHEVYSQQPLQDGEIDVSRLKDFERCVKEEFRQERVRRREEERRLKRERNSM
jgi:hypothetical protein